MGEHCGDCGKRLDWVAVAFGRFNDPVCGRCLINREWANPKRERPCAARFWAWVNGGWVRITLRPGESLAWSSFRWTDEGWSRESIRWEHGGDRVYMGWAEEGKDCDGRMDRSGGATCLIEKLRARDVSADCDASENRGIMAPEWFDGASEQRDYTAEAAGY